VAEKTTYKLRKTSLALSKYDEFMEEAVEEWRVERLRMASELETLQQEVEDATSEVHTIKMKMVGAEGSQEEAAELRQSLITGEEKYMKKYLEVEKYKTQLKTEYNVSWREEMKMMERTMEENSNMGSDGGSGASPSGKDGDTTPESNAAAGSVGVGGGNSSKRGDGNPRIRGVRGLRSDDYSGIRSV
jgi:hypothetical protein